MIKYQKFILSKILYLGMGAEGPTEFTSDPELQEDLPSSEEQESLDFEAKRYEAIKEISAIASLLPNN